MNITIEIERGEYWAIIDDAYSGLGDTPEQAVADAFVMYNREQDSILLGRIEEARNEREAHQLKANDLTTRIDNLKSRLHTKQV